MTHRFTELLSIEPFGVDHYVVRPVGKGFLFGGFSMAMLLRAAAATVDPDWAPISLHATFVAGGDWAGPHVFKVDRVNDNDFVAARRVEMSADGRLAVVANITFGAPESGEDWPAAQPLEAKAPETLEVFRDKMPAQVIEVRPVSPGSRNVMERLHPFWVRPVEDLHDPLLQACALVFASDYRVFATPFPVGSDRGRGLTSRTYIHSVTFHRPLEGVDWWYFDCEPKSVAGGRFTSDGTVRGRDGALLASFTQHGYIRATPAV